MKVYLENVGMHQYLIIPFTLTLLILVDTKIILIKIVHT